MVNEVSEWEPTFLHLSLSSSTVVMPISNGIILIITIHVYVMRCNPEERRTSYSRHSFGWLVVIECIYIQWEKFHSFRSIEDDSHNTITAQLSLTWTMRDVTRQTATAFHYKITVSNESWWHVAALSRSGKILSVALQLTRLTTTSEYLCSTFGGSLLLRRSKSTNPSTKW